MNTVATIAPTRVRYRVLALMCSLAMITYLDRALNGSAQEPLMHAVGKHKEDFFWLLVAFQIAYALFEIPTGWLGDRFGPRNTLLRIVLWWSLFLGLMSLAGLPLLGTSLAIGYGSLIVMQFLFGMGEAGAFPNISKALYNWFPATQRAMVQGMIWLSSRLMGGLTPFLWVMLVPVVGLSWRAAILLFVGLGIVWCLVYFFSFRNHPEEHAETNEAERELIGQGKASRSGGDHSAVPWGRIFRSPNLWFLCGMYFCSNFGWYFLMYFLPGFMKTNFGLDQIGTEASASTQLGVALLTGSPLLLGGLGCLLGGFLSDAYIRRTGNRTWGRRWVGVLGYGMAALSYVAAIFFHGNPLAVTACIALVGFSNDLTLGPSWATAQDIGRRYAATVSGCMNMIGNLGAALSNFTTGMILLKYTQAGQREEGYVLCLTLYAIAFGMGVIFWLLVDANKPIVED